MCTAVLAAAAVAASAAQASATSDRAALRAAMRRLDRLSNRHAALVRAEDAARARLASARADASAARRAVVAERRQLALARRELAAAVIGDYKVGTPDAAAYMLDAASLSDLVTRVDVLGRIDTAQAGLVARIRAATLGLRRQQARVAAASAAAHRSLARIRVARGRIDAAIAARTRYLTALSARLRAEVGAEQSRRSRLAGRHPQRPGGVSFSGEASWYGPGFAGHRTADGEIFDPNALTAASPWLPFNTILRVTNTVTGRSVTVRINDRGPFGRGVLDLSAHAARVVGLHGWMMVDAVAVSAPA